jgi:hypothetical protein
MSLPSSGSKNKPSKKPAGSRYLAEPMVEATCFSTVLVDFNGLHIVISQKIELFVTTAVRTLDPTQCKVGLLTDKKSSCLSFLTLGGPLMSIDGIYVYSDTDWSCL